jgi:transposase-like protein
MKKVERWQAEKIKQAVGLMLRYLTLLRERMERRGFPQSDRFMQTVHRAWEGVYSLSVAVHYLSCEGGVGSNSDAI